MSAAPALTSLRGPGGNAVTIGGKGDKWKMLATDEWPERGEKFNTEKC
jgi:hypothetical protein